MTTMYIPRIVFGSSKTDTVFLLKRKTLFVLLSFLTLYHQHILCDLVVVFGSPCLILMTRKVLEAARDEIAAQEYQAISVPVEHQ